jgi:hypothetical protein
MRKIIILCHPWKQSCSVSGYQILSLLDGFLGYNQVLVVHDNQLNTSFQTKWGTYAYNKMPFGLINVGETFYSAMNIAFKGQNGDCVVVYMDDVIVFSKDKRDHLVHLRKIFNKCRRYGISLNPKKFLFVFDEGKLLGFNVSKYGVMIEPKRTEAI